MASGASVKMLPWRGEALVAAGKKAFVLAVKDVQRVAQAKNPAPSKIKIRVPSLNTSSGSAIVTGTGKLAHIFEEGRSGGYPIAPTGKTRALKFPGGGFAAYATGGPMAARPYMRPALETFPSAYRFRAASEMGRAL